jgi:hypothetical protein
MNQSAGRAESVKRLATGPLTMVRLHDQIGSRIHPASYQQEFEYKAVEAWSSSLTTPKPRLRLNGILLRHRGSLYKASGTPVRFASRPTHNTCRADGQRAVISKQIMSKILLHRCGLHSRLGFTRSPDQILTRQPDILSGINFQPKGMFKSVTVRNSPFPKPFYT